MRWQLCQNTTLLFQPPPDLYALAADKTATQHIAKSHHSWHATHPIENILPDICCHTYIAKYCHQQVKGWCTKQLEYIAILQLLSFLKLQNPLVPSFLLCKPAQHQLMLCHLPFYFVQLFRRQICLFFISFSLVPSMCPSILFLQK